MALYAHARRFMRENGNPTQWGDTNPPASAVRRDIELGQSYVAQEDGRILAVFAFIQGIDPTYLEIDGAWHYDLPYGVIHRVASYGGRNAASECIKWCAQRCDYLRMDTHKDNIPMQRVIAKNGFSYCGVVVIADGTQRLAFDRLVRQG